MSTPLSLLIVDDNEDDRYILSRYLRQVGPDVHVFECCDGKEALEFFEHAEEHRERHGELFPPSLVFLDVNMPRMDGFQFLEAFSKLPGGDGAGPTSAIILFTSSDLDDDRKRALAYPVVKQYLLKNELSVGTLEAMLAVLAGT